MIEAGPRADRKASAGQPAGDLVGRDAHAWGRATLAVTTSLTIAALAQLVWIALRTGALYTSWKWQLALALGAVGLALEAGLLAASRDGSHPRLLAWVRLPERAFQRSRWLALALILAFPLLVLGPTGRFLQDLFPRLLVFWLLAVISASAVQAFLPALGRWEGLAGVLLLQGAVYRIAAFLPDLSIYPFSLGWSEASRYYYASLFFAESIYGAWVPTSVLHPSRYLLQSLPFLIPDSPLWLHRLWQVVLWVCLPAGAAYLTAWRLNLPSRALRWLVALWAFLFLFQGPVLYHLLISVIVVLWAFESRRLGRSLAFVLLASIWAGLSRINWVPMPGFLAATLYLLERPVEGRPLRRYLLPPALWIGLGGLTALGTQAAYMVWSGNAAEQFGSSFSSHLLWYRLLPSPTYRLGVLPAITLASLPGFLVLWASLRHRLAKFHPVRPLALGGMLLILFLGGVIVSAKIGGGSNLHNLDVYLILLAVIGSHVYFGRFTPDAPAAPPSRPVGRSTHALIVAVPLLFILTLGGPLPARDHALAHRYLADLRAHVSTARARGGDVLFISERHLLTFGLIEDVPLVPEYEKVFLMEMAMSGNPGYLRSLQEDLQRHRFSLIVSHPLKIQYQGRARPFGEENDAWVKNVSVPILCYYKPLVTYEGLQVQLLAPLETPRDCP